MVYDDSSEDGGLDEIEAEGAVTPARVQSTKALANEERPDTAYTTERAKKNGLANASSGRVFVTTPEHHFGPITATHDPVHRTGVRVGAKWRNRPECRQWGVHMPMVAGIAGQSKRGAQSVVISGGYEDDEDHGWYFIYTGSGGRDLSGNKRTSKEQSKEQVFTNMNQALKVSCEEGYPVRVIRSAKDHKSAFAPRGVNPKVVRYDGIYRVEKCWRKPGKQNAVMCRFLFVRCDNKPPPWDSDGSADPPHRTIPVIAELDGACDVFERVGPPAWDWKEDESCWGWIRDPPPSRHSTPKNPRGKQKNAPQVAFVEYEAPFPADLPPSASEGGNSSEDDSEDDVSHTPCRALPAPGGLASHSSGAWSLETPAASAGQADVARVTEASRATDLNGTGTELRGDVDDVTGRTPDDVSARGADDVSASGADDVSASEVDDVIDGLSAREAGFGSGAPRAAASAADVRSFPRACEGTLTRDVAAGAASGVKEAEGGALQALLTPKGENRGEGPVVEPGVNNTSGRAWPADLTPETGAEAARECSWLQPRKLLSDFSAASEEARAEEPVDRVNGGVKEQSSDALLEELTPLSGRSGSEGFGAAAKLAAKPGDVAADLAGGGQDAESEEESAEPEHVETSKDRKRRALLAQLKSLREAKRRLRAHEAYLTSNFSHKGPEASEGPLIAASDDSSGSEGAPADDVSRSHTPAQPDISGSDAAAEVSKGADGVSASGAGSVLDDFTRASLDGARATNTECGGSGMSPGRGLGRTPFWGREKAGDPVETGTNVKILGEAVPETGLTPELVREKTPAASSAQPHSLPFLSPSVESVSGLQAVVGTGNGVKEAGSGAVPECLTPGSGSNESGSSTRDRGVEPEVLPASPPSIPAKSDDVAVMSAGDPFKSRADLGAGASDEPVLVGGPLTQKANKSMEMAGTVEGEPRKAAALQMPPTPEKGELLAQPGTRTSPASLPESLPGSTAAEPGTGVGRLTARLILPGALAQEAGSLAGQLGIGSGQAEAERSQGGSPAGLCVEGELERGERLPKSELIVRELMRVARESEARCREMESKWRVARTVARTAKERAEDSARSSEERARESERRARDGEARTLGAGEKTGLAENRARLAEDLAGGAGKRAREAEERARLAEKRAWDHEMTGRALEKRARESEARAHELETLFRESEAKRRESEEKLRVSEAPGRAKEAAKRGAEERWAAESRNMTEQDRDAICKSAARLLWGIGGSPGSLEKGSVTARGVIESVGALTELLEELEGRPGKGTGGLIDRAREQLLVLRTEVRRSREETGMLESMLEQSEQLREELTKQMCGTPVETGGGVGGLVRREGAVLAGVEKATQTEAKAGRGEEKATQTEGVAGAQPRADVIARGADVSELRAELEGVKQAYRELVGLFEREQKKGRGT